MERPAYHTFVKYFKDQASAMERQSIELWADRSEKNAIELQELRLIWDSHGDRFDQYSPDLRDGWHKIRSKVTHGEVRPLKDLIYRIAAMIVMCVALGLLITKYVSSPVDQANKRVTSITAQQGKASFKLPDGSSVTLNKGSKANYKSGFGVDHRKLLLEGEAYFEVRRNEILPFVISAGNTETKVLGTSFLITPGQNEIILTVVSGKVAFKGRDTQTLVVTKGEKAICFREGKQIKKQTNDRLNFLAWKTGVLVFRETPLKAVVQDLERCYQVKITTSGDLNDYPITATFDHQSLAEVLEVIAATLDVEIKKNSETIYHMQKLNKTH